MSYTIERVDVPGPVHTYRWSLLKDGKPIGEFFTQADAETIRAALNGEKLQDLLEQWRERSAASQANNEFLVSPGWDVQRCADELEAVIAQQDTSQPTAEQER